MEAETARPVVVSVHGIKTRGKWQKDLSPVLAEAGFIPELMDYGNFFAISMLIPILRRRKVEWFFREYTRIGNDHKGSPISIVAHSFGTYLVARSLEKYRDHIHYDRIVFCGSIVRPNFPWSDLAAEGRVRHVLNEFGHMDFWAWVAAFLVKDAGQAGRYGFNDADGCLTQREHPEHRHSDYFHPKNYRETWVPFLKGATLKSLKVTAGDYVNPHFQETKRWLSRLLGVTAMVLLALLFLWWVVRRGGCNIQRDESNLLRLTSAPSADPRADGFSAVSHCAEPEGWVRAKATLDAHRAIMSVSIGIETDSVAAGPKGKAVIVLRDAQGVELAKIESGEVGIGGKGVGNAFKRVFSGEINVPEHIASKTSSIDVSAVVVGTSSRESGTDERGGITNFTVTPTPK